MHRRLPIYFLIDVSESMIGEQIDQVETGLATIIKELKSDPYALETVYLSVIVFAGQPRTVIPLQELIHFYPPKFPIGGGTSLGAALGHLMFELRRNTILNSPERKGDWKPIIFLFTDGVPTDDTTQAIQEWKDNWQRKVNLVSVSFGEENDMSILHSLSENVLIFQNSTINSYKEFFKWVTASIKSSSESVESNGSGFEMALLKSDILKKHNVVDKPENLQFTDPNYAVLLGKCQNIKRPYLIKYKKELVHTDILGLDLSTRIYKLVNAYAIQEDYFELSIQNQNGGSSISTDELRGMPTCPCCGNQWGLAICKCGNIHCVGEESISQCPWCGNQGSYGFGSGSLDINRTQG